MSRAALTPDMVPPEGKPERSSGKARRVVRKWTLQEMTFLIDNAKDMTVDEIAEHLGRSPQGINHKARSFGIRVKKYPKGRGNCRTFGTPWSDADLEQLKGLWQAGTPVKDIAAALGRTVPSIKCIVFKCRLEKRDSSRGWRRNIPRADFLEAVKLYDAGLGITEISRRTGIPQSVISRRLPRWRKEAKLDDREVEIIEERWKDGCSVGCIGRRIRRSPGTVFNLIKYLEFESDFQETDDLVVDLLKGGLSVDQIAYKLELPRESIICAIKRLPADFRARHFPPEAEASPRQS